MGRQSGREENGDEAGDALHDESLRCQQTEHVAEAATQFIRKKLLPTRNTIRRPCYLGPPAGLRTTTFRPEALRPHLSASMPFSNEPAE